MIICIRAPDGPTINCDKMVWNLPNTLTWLRIFAIPLVIVLFYLPYHWADPAAGLLFAVAGITDSLDGYFARRMGQTSRLGAFLDPVADKLIVAVALVLLVSKDMPPSSCPASRASTADGNTALGVGARHPGALRRRHHRPRDRDLGAARMDGRDRAARQGQGEPARQVQDHPADRRAVLHVVPLESRVMPGFSLPVFDIGLVLTVVAAALTLWSAIQYLNACASVNAPSCEHRNGRLIGGHRRQRYRRFQCRWFRRQCADRHLREPAVQRQDNCTRGACTQPPCPNGGKTTVSGIVYDPAGKTPLYNVRRLCSQRAAGGLFRPARRATPVRRHIRGVRSPSTLTDSKRCASRSSYMPGAQHPAGHPGREVAACCSPFRPVASCADNARERRGR